MKDNFEKCLEIILYHEGGYVDHPEDPGGETNLGITKKVYEKWNGTKDMRDLTVEDVTPIYKENYWKQVKGDSLPIGLDLCVFDFGVNAGPGRGVRFLQRILNVTQDGDIGPITLSALENYLKENSVGEIIKQYQDDRQVYYEKLHHFPTFGRGWTRRVKETSEFAEKMIIRLKFFPDIDKYYYEYRI